MATKNLHLATIFYHLVATWRLKDFFNFEPCIAQNVLAHIFKRHYLNIKLGSPIPVFDVGQIFLV